MLLRRLGDALRTDSAYWRRALRAGVERGPDAWVRHSPPLIGMAFGAALGGARRRVLATLREIHGQRPMHAELLDAAAVFANFASSMTDGMLVGTARGYFATSRLVGDWHFLSALAQRRGVIVVTAQTAGWDVAGAVLHADQGADVWVVMEREANEAARALHDVYRERSGVRVVHVGDDPLASLPLLRHLRRGGVVALKIDRVAAGMRTRAVRFLGQRWQIPEGPLSLAALTGAPILPVFTRRLGFLEYEALVHSAIRLPRRATQDELDAAAQRMADDLEAFVRAHPTQWFRFG